MITPSSYRRLAETTSDEKIEEAIDAQIVQHAMFTKRTPVRIATSLLGQDEVINRVLLKYRENGWDAKLIRDERDGDYVELSPQ